MSLSITVLLEGVLKRMSTYKWSQKTRGTTRGRVLVYTVVMGVVVYTVVMGVVSQEIDISEWSQRALNKNPAGPGPKLNYGGAI